MLDQNAFVCDVGYIYNKRLFCRLLIKKEKGSVRQKGLKYNSVAQKEHLCIQPKDKHFRM